MALHNININCNCISYFLLTIHRLALANQVIRLYAKLNLVILNLHEWFTNRLILNIDKTKVLPYKDEHIINSI